MPMNVKQEDTLPLSAYETAIMQDLVVDLSQKITRLMVEELALCQAAIPNKSPSKEFAILVSLIFANITSIQVFLHGVVPDERVKEILLQDASATLLTNPDMSDIGV